MKNLFSILLLFLVFACESSESEEEDGMRGVRNTSIYSGNYQAVFINSKITTLQMNVTEKGTFTANFVFDQKEYSIQGNMYTDNSFDATFNDLYLFGQILPMSDAGSIMNTISLRVGDRDIIDNDIHGVFFTKERCDFVINYEEGIYKGKYQKTIDNDSSKEIAITLTVKDAKISITSEEFPNQRVDVTINNCGEFVGSNASFAVQGQLFNFVVSEQYAEVEIRFSDSGTFVTNIILQD